MSTEIKHERQRLYGAWQEANARAAAVIGERSSGALSGCRLARLQAEEDTAASIVVQYWRFITDHQADENVVRVTVTATLWPPPPRPEAPAPNFR